MAQQTRQHRRAPVIGVTGNARTFSPSWFCIRLAIWLAGGKAVRIHVGKSVDPASLDALVISGGDDIHPSLFNEEPAPEVFYDDARDQLEIEYLEKASARALPVLGICRGQQLMNVTMGGTLLTDIREMRKLTYNRRGLLATKTAHIEPESQLRRLLDRSRVRINSLHYQAIDRIAPEFSLAATDLDGFCQAIESPGRKMLGVQWHPEYMFYLGTQRRIFKWLVSQAGQQM